jgi:hypothetical protein
MLDISRRKALGLLAAVSVPPMAVVAAVAAEPALPTIDDFLATALPADRVNYHAKALADAMAEMHPGHSWCTHVVHEHHYAMIVGDMQNRRVPVAKVYVDDGSPLLADDVTGTTAFADWEASL